VREAGRIVSVAVTIAVAVNTDGRREVLGMGIDASEAETFWVEFLRRLKRRGVALLFKEVVHPGGSCREVGLSR
jgi:transposase-like protein